MILRLVWQSIRFAPGRSVLMLLGYALGVGVMVALLSIGDALVEQSRDRDLLGGGDLAVLPAGIDLETLRTGGVSSLYFRLNLARFFHREVLAGPRLAGSIATTAPWLDDELLYVRRGDSVIAVSAGGEIPSAAAALGAGPALVTGEWNDRRVDRRWTSPTPAERLEEIDAFHAPTAAAVGDSTWAEWHYFNVLHPAGDRWLYFTYLVGGDLAGDRWGGQLLGTYVSAEGDRTYVANAEAADVRWHPGEVDVEILGAHVRLESDGSYRLWATVPAADGPDDDSLRIELRVDPEPRRYLPSVDISPGDFPSGYAVPVLRGSATGTVCRAGACEDWTGGRAYHDHNWGVWRDVTWNWGQFQAGQWSIVYGGVQRGEAAGEAMEDAAFLFAVDSLGLAAVLPVREIAYEWASSVPRALRLEAFRGDDRIVIEAEAGHVRATPRDRERGPGDLFFQLRGPAVISGSVGGDSLSAPGDGFFETWRRNPDDGHTTEDM